MGQSAATYSCLALRRERKPLLNRCITLVWKHMPRSLFGSAGNGFLISLGLGNGSAKEYLLTCNSLFYLECCFFCAKLLFFWSMTIHQQREGREGHVPLAVLPCISRAVSSLISHEGQGQHNDSACFALSGVLGWVHFHAWFLSPGSSWHKHGHKIWSLIKTFENEQVGRYPPLLSGWT